MKNDAPIPTVLKSLNAVTAAIGFDPINRTWVTDAIAASVIDPMPPLSGVLCVDDASCAAASDDFGHVVHRLPSAVLKPGSIEDVISIVQFARKHQFKIAARGQGHATYGQSQVEAGVVVDMSSLNAIHSIDSSGAVADAGALWISLLSAAAASQLTPPVLTDYLELSIGGTLSVGGIGGATHRYGVQLDNVLEIQVVTGEGKLEICSPSHNSELFEAVLGGLGQCGIIVRATVRLVAAETHARVFHLFYDNLTTFTRDQCLAIADERFHYLEGQIVPTPSGSWQYKLEAVSFFTPPAAPSNSNLLADLHYRRGEEKIEDTSYFDFANRMAPDVIELKSIGVWSCPHPWFEVFVPATIVEQYIGDIVATLTLADTGSGPILLYPVKTAHFKLPLFRVPDEPVAFLLAILRNAPRDRDVISKMLASNRTLFERARQMGGYRYPSGAIPFSPPDWQQHFGSVWDWLQSAKRRYDPDNLLAPGQGIF